MKTLMYPIAPEDDFPDEFCAIRQGSGEHTFYTPVGESASWMLLRAEAENAKLRKLALDFYDAIDSVFWDGEKETKERFKPRMREVGVEVDE